MNEFTSSKLLKNITITAGCLVVLVLALVGTLKGSEVYKQILNTKPDNTMTVSAEGKVPAVPDTATINVGVFAQGDSPDQVQTETTKKVNKIIEYLKTQGVNKEDIVTDQFNMYPLQNYNNGTPQITGYQVNQSVTIKLHEIDKSTERLNKVLGGLTGVGVNQINGVSLSFDDPDNLRQQARQEAIAKAKEKAKQLADAAGIHLGRVISVSESSGVGYPIPYASDYGLGIGGGGAEGKGGVAPNIEPGSQDVTATMTVIFEVK